MGDVGMWSMVRIRCSRRHRRFEWRQTRDTERNPRSEISKLCFEIRWCNPQQSVAGFRGCVHGPIQWQASRDRLPPVPRPPPPPGGPCDVRVPAPRRRPHADGVMRYNGPMDGAAGPLPLPPAGLHDGRTAWFDQNVKTSARPLNPSPH